MAHQVFTDPNIRIAEDTAASAHHRVGRRRIQVIGYVQASAGLGPSPYHGVSAGAGAGTSWRFSRESCHRRVVNDAISRLMQV